jgi:hypothetical protein
VSWDAEELLRVAEREILQARGRVDPLVLLATHPAPGRRDADVLGTLQPVFSAIEETFGVLGPLFERRAPAGSEIGAALQAHDRRLPNRVVKLVYGYLADQVRRRDRQEKEAREKKSLEQLPPLQRMVMQPHVSGLDLDMLSDIEPLPEQLARSQRRHQLLDDLDRVEMDLADHRAEHSLVDQILQSAVNPEGVWEGFAVLVVFAATGIAVPLITIALQPQRLTALHRSVLVGLFLLGLGLLAIYLFRTIRRLRRREQATGSVPPALTRAEGTVQQE